MWSDIACPWCYLGKHRIDAAIAKLGGEHELVFHAFELNPGAPRRYDDGLTHGARVAKKLGIPPAQLEQMHARMVGLGREDGIDFHFERVQGGNTFDAHRLVRLGLERGVQSAVKERHDEGVLLRRRRDGRARDARRLGRRGRARCDEAADVLATEKFTTEVRADEAMAQAIGCQRRAVLRVRQRSGCRAAQPVDMLVDAMREAGG